MCGASEINQWFQRNTVIVFSLTKVLTNQKQSRWAVTSLAAVLFSHALLYSREKQDLDKWH